MAWISAEELAELVPCSLGETERLEGLGLLQRHEESGLFASGDVHVVRLMAAFEEAGISLDDVARGVSANELSFPSGLFLPEPVELSETYDELGARCRRPAELLRRLSGELGFPPTDDRVRADDAEMLSLLVAKLDIADDEELSRFARLYGGSIQRLVASGLQFFDRAVRQRAENLDLPKAEKDEFVYGKAAGFTELAGSIVPWLQRRHREHAVLEYLVGDGGLHGGAGYHSTPAEAAARDRLPRPHRLHDTRRGARRRGGRGARRRPRERRSAGRSEPRRPSGEVAG